MKVEKQRAAIYARVSTEEQATQGFSIKAQLAELHHYAERLDLEVVAEYVDEGVSGKSIEKRHQMKELLKSAQMKQFDYVLVYKLDRIARNLKDALQIGEDLSNNNVRLVILKENIDMSTPTGKMFFQMIGSIAEFERNTIVDRVKMGMKQRAKQGKFNGGICLGYDSLDKKLVVNQTEAEIVREIFNMAENGQGYKMIARRLNERGFKSKKGKLFSIAAIKTILDNPIYIGKIRFNQMENWADKRRKGKNENPILVDGEQEAIITMDQWEKVQGIRSNRSYRPSRSSQPYILNGLLRCPMCGHGMVPNKSKGQNGISYRYYICEQHHNKGAVACKANSIRADIAEKEVLTRISQLVSEPAALKKIISKVNQQRMNALKPLLEDKKRIESELAKIDNYIDKLVTSLLEESLPKSILTPKLQNLEAEKQFLEQKIGQLDNNLTEADTKPVDEQALYLLLTNFQDTLSKVAPEQQKALLRLIVKSITINKAVPKGSTRKVEKVNLYFDFRQENLKLNYELARFILPGIDIKLSINKKVKPSYSKFEVKDLMKVLNILPLLMIRFPTINAKIHPQQSANLME